MPPPTGRVRTARFRESVIDRLRAAGVNASRERFKISGPEDPQTGTSVPQTGFYVAGAPVAVIASAAFTSTFSKHIALADRVAAACGLFGGVVIQQRRETTGVGSSYAAMSLDTLAALLTQLEKNS